MTPVQFMILAQFIIFILGWPLEWTEIIINLHADLPAAAAALRHRPAVLRVCWWR